MILFIAIAFTGFWFYTVRLWVQDGPKIPLAFIGLWILGLFAVGALGLGSHILMGLQALLALTLAIINGYRVPPLN